MDLITNYTNEKDFNAALFPSKIIKEHSREIIHDIMVK